jgi:hypothetical protein
MPSLSSASCPFTSCGSGTMAESAPFAFAGCAKPPPPSKLESPRREPLVDVVVGMGAVTAPTGPEFSPKSPILVAHSCQRYSSSLICEALTEALATPAQQTSRSALPETRVAAAFWQTTWAQKPGSKIFRWLVWWLKMHQDFHCSTISLRKIKSGLVSPYDPSSSCLIATSAWRTHSSTAAS